MRSLINGSARTQAKVVSFISYFHFMRLKHRRSRGVYTSRLNPNLTMWPISEQIPAAYISDKLLVKSHPLLVLKNCPSPYLDLSPKSVPCFVHQHTYGHGRGASGTQQGVSHPLHVRTARRVKHKVFVSCFGPRAVPEQFFQINKSDKRVSVCATLAVMLNTSILASFSQQSPANRRCLGCPQHRMWLDS